MTRYLISFGAHAMDHIPDEDMPAVAKAAHAAVQEAVNAGVLVCSGGLEDQQASIVATDGRVPTARTSARQTGDGDVNLPGLKARQVHAANRCAWSAA